MYHVANEYRVTIHSLDDDATDCSDAHRLSSAMCHAGSLATCTWMSANGLCSWTRARDRARAALCWYEALRLCAIWQFSVSTAWLRYHVTPSQHVVMLRVVISIEFSCVKRVCSATATYGSDSNHPRQLRHIRR